jgi:hypothetical protein
LGPWLGLALAAALLACGAPEPLAVPPKDPLAGAELSDAYALLEAAAAEEPALLERIAARGDHRFAGVLIHLLRANQIGLRPGDHYNAEVVALERLTGQSLGADWLGWLSWYGSSPLRVPPGFLELRARMLTPIDPALAAFFEGRPAERVRSEEIVWSGNGVDQVTPLPPRHGPVGAGPFPDDEPVLGIAWRGAARAYPLGLLDWHQVVNDELGGEPVAVVWCSLCGSGAAFAPGGAGSPRQFGNSGLAYRSVSLLYDLDTRSLWEPLGGRALLGAAAATSERLERLPLALTTWSAWRQRYPDTEVALAPAEQRRGGATSAYGSYRSSPETIFPVPLLREELAPKVQVFGIEVAGRARAWPLDALLAVRVLEDRVGELDLVLVANRDRLRGPGSPSADVAGSPGAEVRVYRSPGVALAPGNAADVLADEAGRRWDVTDAALLGPAGVRAERLPGSLAYWFAWQGLRPDTELWLP